MKDKESITDPQSTSEDHPEWHPFKVWQREIRSHQATNIVRAANIDADILDKTGSWKLEIKNV